MIHLTKTLAERLDEAFIEKRKDNKLLVTFDNGLFVCPIHNILVTWFCEKCRKDQLAKHNEITAQLMLQSRKRSMLIIFLE